MVRNLEISHKGLNSSALVPIPLPIAEENSLLTKSRQAVPQISRPNRVRTSSLVEHSTFPMLNNSNISSKTLLHRVSPAQQVTALNNGTITRFLKNQYLLRTREVQKRKLQSLNPKVQFHPSKLSNQQRIQPLIVRQRVSWQRLRTIHRPSGRPPRRLILTGKPKIHLLTMRPLFCILW